MLGDRPWAVFQRGRGELDFGAWVVPGAVSPTLVHPPEPQVLNAYMLCLGSAVFYLTLSILSGIIASNTAYRKAARP